MTESREEAKIQEVLREPQNDAECQQVTTAPPEKSNRKGFLYGSYNVLPAGTLVV